MTLVGAVLAGTIACLALVLHARVRDYVSNLLLVGTLVGPCIVLPLTAPEMHQAVPESAHLLQAYCVMWITLGLPLLIFRKRVLHYSGLESFPGQHSTAS
jgi:hypothetical protein